MKIKTKKCSTCKKIKTATADDFDRDKSRKDGFQSKCRACQTVYREANTERIAAANKRWRAANPEYAREYRQANIEKIRATDRKQSKRFRAKNPEYNREYRRARRLDYPFRAVFILGDARTREGQRGVLDWVRIDAKLWAPVVAAELERLDKAGEIDMAVNKRASGMSPAISRLDNDFPTYHGNFIIECFRLNMLRGDGPLTPEVIAHVDQASRAFFGHDAAHVPLALPGTPTPK